MVALVPPASHSRGQQQQQQQKPEEDCISCCCCCWLRRRRSPSGVCVGDVVLCARRWRKKNFKVHLEADCSEEEEEGPSVKNAQHVAITIGSCLVFKNSLSWCYSIIMDGDDDARVTPCCVYTIALCVARFPFRLMDSRPHQIAACCSACVSSLGN